LERSPSHLLHRVLQLALDIYAEECGEAGVTQRQFAVLAAVAENEGVTQTGLVRATGIDRSTLADMVARMITKGHLERQRSERGRPRQQRAPDRRRPRRAGGHPPRWWPWPTPASWPCSSPASARASWTCCPTWPAPTAPGRAEPKAKKAKAPKAEKARKKDKKPKKDKAAKKAA
jgi:hypothetical protein